MNASTLAWIANLAVMEHVALKHRARACLRWTVASSTRHRCGAECGTLRVHCPIHYSSGRRRLSCRGPGSVSVTGMSWTVSTGSLQGQRRQMLDWFQAAKPPPPPPAGTQRLGHEAFISSRGVNSPTCWPSNRSARRRRRATSGAVSTDERTQYLSADRSSPASFCRVVAHLCKTGTSLDRSRGRRAF